MTAAPEFLPVTDPLLLRIADHGPTTDHAPAPGWHTPLLDTLPAGPPPPGDAGWTGPGGTGPGGPWTPGRSTRPGRLTAAGGSGRRHGVVPAEEPAVAAAGGTARAVIEVLAGRRPPGQLGTLLDGRTLAAVRTMARGGPHRPLAGAAVTTVRVHRPTARAIEAAVMFRCDGRTRAMALRLDRIRDRWLCTALRIG